MKTIIETVKSYFGFDGNKEAVAEQTQIGTIEAWRELAIEKSNELDQANRIIAGLKDEVYRLNKILETKELMEKMLNEN